MKLFKRDIINEIIKAKGDYLAKTNTEATDILLDKSELKLLAEKAFYSFQFHSGGDSGCMVIGLTVHAEKEGNTVFNLKDYL